MIQQLSLDLSNYCSKACVFCYNHSHRAGNTQWQPEEVIAFARDCIAHGTKAISLGGGEPFEYLGIFDVIRALYPLCYLTVTSNGLPLEDPALWERLQADKPDKIHLTIHFPDQPREVERVLRRVELLGTIGIKAGINLLVSALQVESAKRVYAEASSLLQPDQIILIPQRFSHTPSPRELASVAGGKPFQSPACLLACKKPERFVSVSWDKQVNHCSFAGGKAPLPSLDYDGLCQALASTCFSRCY